MIFALLLLQAWFPLFPHTSYFVFLDWLKHILLSLDSESLSTEFSVFECFSLPQSSPVHTSSLLSSPVTPKLTNCPTHSSKLTLCHTPLTA